MSLSSRLRRQRSSDASRVEPASERDMLFNNYVRYPSEQTMLIDICGTSCFGQLAGNKYYFEGDVAVGIQSCGSIWRIVVSVNSINRWSHGALSDLLGPRVADCLLTPHGRFLMPVGQGETVKLLRVDWDELSQLFRQLEESFAFGAQIGS